MGNDFDFNVAIVDDKQSNRDRCVEDYRYYRWKFW